MSIASYRSQDKDKATFQTIKIRMIGQTSPLMDDETTR